MECALFSSVCLSYFDLFFVCFAFTLFHYLYTVSGKKDYPKQIPIIEQNMSDLSEISHVQTLRSISVQIYILFHKKNTE